MGTFDDFKDRRTVLLTTYKRDGSAVPTPVNVVVLDDHAYFRTWSEAGKVKRLRRDPKVLVAPSTSRGKPIGAAIAATARRLEPGEEGPVSEALSRKHPILQRWIVPLIHRLRHYQTVHYELTG